MAQGIAVVTGASSGIGSETVVALSQRGFEVHAVARRSERLQKLSDETGCVPVVLDVRDSDAVYRLLADKRIDILVNNAGVGLGTDRGGLVDLQADAISTAISTNVESALHFTRAVLPRMIERDVGHIINVGSVNGLYPTHSALYGATKAAIHMFSSNLRAELRGTRIRVTEICPGRVATEFIRASLGEDAEQRALEAADHLLRASDVVGAILYSIDAPWWVNVSRVELLPIEQINGGSRFVKLRQRELVDRVDRDRTTDP